MTENHGGPDRNAHLIERAAAQLRAAAGLAAPDPGTVDPFGAPLGQLLRAHGEVLARPRPPVTGSADLLLAEPGGPPAEADGPAACGAGNQVAPTGDLPPGGAQSPPVPAMFLDMAGLQRAGLALGGPRSRVTEEYRITVGRILRTLRAGARGGSGMATILMVTSARPGEGKSFSSLNIAASIAQNGLADVLLVDVDGKPRSITALLGLGGQPGLLDLVGNQALRPEDLVVGTGIAGLSVLPLGRARPAGADGGMSRGAISAVERIRRRFNQHILLLDSPPCLSTSDPSTLAPMVDQVVMVVEAGRTQRSELGAALELVRACPNVILVLNKVRLTHRHSFGSYYYFGAPT
jgi:receptor protein-tyrosine kinase